MFAFHKMMFIGQLLLGCSTMTTFIGTYFNNCGTRFNRVDLQITRSILRIGRNVQKIADTQVMNQSILLRTKGLQKQQNGFASVECEKVAENSVTHTEELKNSPVNKPEKDLYLFRGLSDPVKIFCVVNDIPAYYYYASHKCQEV